MANELVVIEKSGILVTDSRDVAIMISKRHDHLVRDIENYISVLESPTLGNGLDIKSEDFFIPSEYQVDGSSRNYKCYLITKKGCDMVANKMIGEKGILFTATYVSKFEEMDNKLNQMLLPSNYIEALKALVCSEEEKVKLQEQNEFAKKLLQEKEEVIITMQPKVDFADTLLESKDTLLVREYAKVLQKDGFTLGQGNLFKWLRDSRYLMDDNEPYQAYMKYFIVKETAIDTKYGVKITKTPKINAKGQYYFYKKLKSEGYFKENLSVQ